MAPLLILVLLVLGNSSGVLCHGPKQIIVDVYVFYLVGSIMIIMLLVIIYLCFQLRRLKYSMVIQTHTVQTDNFKRNGSTQTLNSGITEINDMYSPKIPVLAVKETKTPIIIKKSFAPNIPIIQKHQMDKIVEEVLKRKARSESGTFKELMALAKRKSSISKSAKTNKPGGDGDSKSDELYGNIGVSVESTNDAVETELKDSETKIEITVDDKENKSSSQKFSHDVADLVKNSLAVNNELAENCYDKLSKFEETYDTLPNQSLKGEEVYDTVPNQTVELEVYDTLPKQTIKIDELYDTVPNQTIYQGEEVYDTVPNTPTKSYDVYLIEKSDELTKVADKSDANTSNVSQNKVSYNKLSTGDSGNIDLDKRDKKKTLTVDVYENIPSSSKIRNTKVIVDEDTNYTIIIGNDVLQSDSSYVNLNNTLL